MIAVAKSYICNIHIHIYTTRAWSAIANIDNIIENYGDNGNNSNEKYQAQNDDQASIGFYYLCGYFLHLCPIGCNLRFTCRG
jgi:hypothetical protein